MGFRFAKSIRLGGGGRLNLSRKGIGASWGFKGFRVGVSPRTGGYARTGLGLLNFGRGKRISGAGCSNSGCGVLLFGAVVLFVAAAILRAVVAVFSTPYPWIALGLVLSFFLLRPVIRRFRRDRLEKVFFDALAAVDERAPDAEERLRILLRQAPEQADGYLLVAAHAADAGLVDPALEALGRAEAFAPTLGDLAGELDLRFQGAPVPLRFDNSAASVRGIALARAAVQIAAGRGHDALVSIGYGEEGTPDDIVTRALEADALCLAGKPHLALKALGRATPECADLPIREVVLGRVGFTAEALGDSRLAIDAYGQCAHPAAVARVALLRAQMSAADEAKRVAASEAAQEAAAARERLRYERALAKVEAARGPAGRRAALESALAEIERPDLRERLALEASRLDVQAVLDKVDELKTAAAKRRHLVAALEALRNDDLPDELQRAEFDALESALRELDS